MFTGIITHIGTVLSGPPQLTIRHPASLGELAPGESVACNGACLTVAVVGNNEARFDVSPETIARTAPGSWDAGKSIHLERALKLDDRLSGHLVTGHVDGVAVLKESAVRDGCLLWTVEAPEPLVKFIAEKGSVTLDGVSLTVNAVRGNLFEVTIIPHTQQATMFKQKNPGEGLNIEVDLMARYAARLIEAD